MSNVGLFLTICSADKCQHFLASPRCVCKNALGVCSFITVSADNVIETFMACFLKKILYIDIVQLALLERHSAAVVVKQIFASRTSIEGG
jgi:hypothetical protein